MFTEQLECKSNRLIQSTFHFNFVLLTNHLLAMWFYTDKLSHYDTKLKTRVMKILWAIILKYLTFNTYTLVASRKKRALHTRSHQKLGTHCCVQRSPTNRLNRFLQQKVKQCGSKHYYHLIRLKKNKNQRYIAKINKISWQAKALTALQKSLNLTAKQRMQRLPEARSSFLCNVSELL